MHILLFGPEGRTGAHILRQALAAGHRVRAAERSWSDSAPDHDRLDKRTIDLLEDDPADLMDGIDVVISAIGLGRSPMTLLDPPPLYTDGTKAIVDAMQQAGCKRLITMSAAFVDASNSIPLWFRAASLPLTNIFSQMADMETYLGTLDDIDWTAVRPGWLLNRRATGDYSLAKADLPKGTLRSRRADVADFMLRCAVEDIYIRETPHIARREACFEESPAALAEEILLS